MRESRAAAEVAALEDLLSSPDTQECRRIFQASIGCDFDSHITINDCTHAQRPQFSRSKITQSQSNLGNIVPDIRISHFPQELGFLTNSQDSLYAQRAAPHFTSASGRDTHHARSDLIKPREHLQSQSTYVHPARPLALQQGPENFINSRSYGIAVVSGSRLSKMENSISPLYGSDGSNLTPTQENDPAVYERLALQLLARCSTSQSSGQARASATQEMAVNNGSVPSAEETEITYTVNDTGHMTLDYQPPISNPLQDSFDEDGQEVSSGMLKPQLIDSPTLHPQTPAQARLIIEHPGTMMRPSQMFAETQPSPGSRDRHMLPPSSSRPSPDVFNQYLPSKHLVSSPLVRRLDKLHSGDAVDFNISSSPERSQPGGNGGQRDGTHQPLLERQDILTNTAVELFTNGNYMLQNFPEPFDVYTTVQESQERRRQQATMCDDADQPSDDGFSDDEAERNRRARRRKEEAARELAVIGTPRQGSAEKDFVEVPSTNNGRRRSRSEEYEAQCSGLDARTTQPDATILDSQSAPADVADSSAGEISRGVSDDCQSDLQTLHYNQKSQEDTARSRNASSDGFTERLPAWEHSGDSEATESDRECSKSPSRQHATSQMPSNIADLQTPAMHKKLPYVDGDTIILETSPSEPHLQLYGDVVSQTPPVLSAEEVDDAFNPLTQDTEFNNLMQSPSPRRTKKLQPAQAMLVTKDTNMKSDAVSIQCKTVNGISGSVLNLSIIEELQTAHAMSLVSRDTASDDTSDYVTAPTSLPPGSANALNAHSNLEADFFNRGSQAPHGRNLVENIEHRSQISLDKKTLVASKVVLPEEGQHFVSTHPAQAALKIRISVPPEMPKDLRCDENNAVSGFSKENFYLGSSDFQPAKRRKLSSRSSNKPIQKGEADSSEIVDDVSANVELEQSDIISTRLRPAAQLRGSSRALRRLLEDGVVTDSVPASQRVTVTPAIQKTTRSSRRSSANSSEKAGSTEPEASITPSLSTRRRTLSNQPSEPGLFESMAFSVTYSANKEEEKKAVLSMIKKNGGRVLEKGFDELFDIPSPQTSSFIRNNEVGGPTEGSSLTLNASAGRVGFACVIADEHSRRVKFMQALALGLPCISGRWIKHCIAKKQILDWDQYHLATGESSLLGGAVRSRNLAPYPANTANFAKRFELRPKLLTGKSILLITGKGKVEERRKPYFFLTQALGARRVMHVPNNQEARKFLLAAESNGEQWDWVYVDENEDEAEKAIFGVAAAPQRKRKRGSEVFEGGENTIPTPRKVRIISDEYVIQSLILGKFLEE